MQLSRYTMFVEIPERYAKIRAVIEMNMPHHIMYYHIDRWLGTLYSPQTIYLVLYVACCMLGQYHIAA